MATVNKNFRIKNGLVVEGSTATVNGEDILTKSAADQSYIVDLIGGQATSANTANTVVKRDANGNFSAGTITADLVGNVTGNASTASALETARTIELTGDITGSVSFDGSSNVQLATTLNADFATDAEVAAAKSEAISAAASDATTKANAAQTAAESYADSLASNYDPAGSAAAAQSAAESYADGLAVNYDAAGSASAAEAAANSYTDAEIVTALSTAQGYADAAEADAIAAAALDATTKANTAEQNAKDYADSLAVNYDIAGAAATAEANANSYTDTAVANLVDGAPALLDTLNELAAAIADNPNYATDVANLVATKADTSYVDSEISDLDTALRSYADAAEADAKSYADGLASNYDAAGSAAAAQTAAESYADGLAGDILDGTSDFTALDVNSVSRQVAATTGNISPAAPTTALSWAKASYRSAKIVIKAKNGSHTHVSELIVTLDTSDNIALNEYGITTTNGSLMTIDADISGTDVRVRVTPEHDNTEVMAHATLLV